MAKPSAEFVAGILATWFSGGVAVPLALSYPETELLHVMNDAVCPWIEYISTFRWPFDTSEFSLWITLNLYPAPYVLLLFKILLCAYPSNNTLVQFLYSSSLWFLPLKRCHDFGREWVFLCKFHNVVQQRWNWWHLRVENSVLK